ncbi:MAG: hypothetical protein FWE08_06090 [Oscillospiraceae bacterium]|nr:hypothetical protein [Oscillospiraceae bacterium]
MSNIRRIQHLASHSKKMRVRKKNKKRLMRLGVIPSVERIAEGLRRLSAAMRAAGMSVEEFSRMVKAWQSFGGSECSEQNEDGQAQK